MDRVEVIFAWSQFLNDHESDLPGREFLAPLTQLDQFEFAGKQWEQWRNQRRYSTALSAPVNYGPAAKTLGWIEASDTYRGAFVSSQRVGPALDAFEKTLGQDIHHPAFSKIGRAVVTRQEAQMWGKAWDIKEPLPEERDAMRACLSDASRSLALQNASACIAETILFRNGDVDALQVRIDLSGSPSPFIPSSTSLSDVTRTWRAVQTRQLFRLALEALLHWTTMIVSDGPQHTARLVELFLRDSGNASNVTDWLGYSVDQFLSLPEEIGLLQDALSRDAEIEALPLAIRRALAVSLRDSFDDMVVQSSDRLPISRAQKETEAFLNGVPRDFVLHVLSSWVFGQHVFWSVGRGLGDARGRGKTILRLKVVPEEDGWTLAPGTNIRNSPRSTPDRLETAVSLMRQAGMFIAGDSTTSE